MGGHSNLKHREPFINYRTVLDYFGGDNVDGRKRYWQFVYRGLGEELSNPLESGKGLGIVGSEGFIEMIRAKYLDKIKPEFQREQPHLKEVKKKFQPEELIELFCEIAEVDRVHYEPGTFSLPSQQEIHQNTMNFTNARVAEKQA